MPPLRIVIYGAGGQGAIVADILQCAGTPPVAFIEDEPARRGFKILGVEIVGSSLDEIEHDAVVVAIGDNHVRRLKTDLLIAAGETIATAIHPFTSIAASATIGEGAMISAGSIVLPRAKIGRGAILNTKSSVDHDSILGDFGHVSAGATVGAESRVGEESLIALGASVISRVSVGARTLIGAGSIVVRDIADDVVAYGVPARVTSDRRSEMPKS